MGWSTVHLTPGVKSEVTPTLNTAGISSSSLIRFMDGLPQKLGGWSQYLNVNIGSVPRELHAWEDLNSTNHLAVGAVNNLYVFTNGSEQDITPQYITNNVAVAFSTTSGSNIVTITDTGSNASVNDVIVLNTQVSVGGIVLYGPYAVSQSVGPNQFNVLAASNATATVTNGGAVPSFTTAANSQSVTVTLANHGLSVGSTFPAIPATSVGGATIQGLYQVSSVISSSQFTINLQYQAVSAATVSMNSGQAQIVHWVTIAQSAAGTGYGIGTYGQGGYGTGIAGPSVSGTPIVASDYTLDNWGQYLIANPEGYGIFTWSPDSGLRGSQLLATGPTACTGMFVAMPQQQIVVYGASVLGVTDPLLVAWCDSSNFTTWAAASNNQAGTFRIPRGSKLVGGLQGPQQGLLWTDLGVWSMQYIGYPLVYGFNEIASGCGLIAKKACVVLGSSVYWMSQKGFYAYVGGAVTPIPCDIWDVIFQNLDLNNLSKIRAAANSQFNEVQWFFPVKGGSGENSMYVKLNLNMSAGSWDYGPMERSAWTNQSVLGPPIGASPEGYIYQHEVSNDAAGVAMQSSFTTGYFTLSEGEEFSFIDLVVPDMKYGSFGSTTSANVQITFNVTDYPWNAPRTYGPYTVNSSTPIINLRARGRLVSMTVASSDLGSFWRLGGIKFRVAPDGRS